MKLVDSSIKFITKSKVFKHSKDFPRGDENKQYFLNTTGDLNRFKSKNFFT